MNLQTSLDSAKRRIFSLDDLDRYLNMFKNGVIIKHYSYEIVFDGRQMIKNNTNIIGQDNNGYFTYYVKNNTIVNLKQFSNIKELVNSIFEEIKIVIEYYKKTYFEQFILFAEEDAFLYFAYKGNEYITDWQSYEGNYRLFKVNAKEEKNEKSCMTKSEYYGQICTLWDLEEMGLSNSTSYSLFQKDSWIKTKKYIIKRIEEN